MADNDKTSNRGFASMDEAKRREIARKGGQNSHKGEQSGNSGSDSSTGSNSEE